MVQSSQLPGAMGPCRKAPEARPNRRWVSGVDDVHGDKGLRRSMWFKRVQVKVAWLTATRLPRGDNVEGGALELISWCPGSRLPGAYFLVPWAPAKWHPVPDNAAGGSGASIS